MYQAGFGQSSFATHALTYEQNVVKIPDDIPFEIAAPMGCGVQTGAGAIMNSLDCEAGTSLVVAGCGVVGLSAVMAGKIRGCDPIAVIEPVNADFICSGAVLMSKGLSVHAIIEGDSHPDSFIPELIAHFKAGRLPLDRLIATYPLKEINTAIKDQSAGDCTKVVLIP